MSRCVFCRIAEREASARIVHQDEDVTAFHDRNPQAPTHILIIPNQHIPRADQVKPADSALLGKLFIVARRVAEQEGIGDYRLVVNNGPRAGQSVYHLHMHLLGGRAMHWPPG